MDGEFRYTGLVLALSFAAALLLVTGYRVAIYRAQRRLHGRSTRDRERNLPSVLRLERRLKRWWSQTRRGPGQRRRRTDARRDDR